MSPKLLNPGCVPPNASCLLMSQPSQKTTGLPWKAWIQRQFLMMTFLHSQQYFWKAVIIENYQLQGILALKLPCRPTLMRLPEVRFINSTRGEEATHK